MSNSAPLAALPNNKGAKGMIDSSLLQPGFSRARVAKGQISYTLLEALPGEAKLVKGLVIGPLSVVVANL